MLWTIWAYGYQTRRRTAETAHGVVFVRKRWCRRSDHSCSGSLGLQIHISSNLLSWFPVSFVFGSSPPGPLLQCFLELYGPYSFKPWYRDLTGRGIIVLVELSRPGVMGPSHTEMPSSMRSPTTVMSEFDIIVSSTGNFNISTLGQ